MTINAFPSLPEEPTWTTEKRDGAMVYTRPLLGSEQFVFQLSYIENGNGDPCFGIIFDSNYRTLELTYKLVKALACVRFVSPLLAASIEPSKDDPTSSSWVYTPLRDAAAAEQWALDSLEVVDRFHNADDFIQDRTQRLLPYRQRDGAAQYFRLFLLLLLDNTYGLFTHGSHAFFDAHPNLNLFNLLLRRVNGIDVTAFESIPWGEEWRNLACGPIASTGGPRNGWSNDAPELFDRLQSIMSNPTPTHALLSATRLVTKPGLATRFCLTLDRSVWQRVVKNIKAKGYSPSHLIEAALAMSVFEYNPDLGVSEDAAHFTMDGAMISLQKYFVPPHNQLSHVVSALCFVPVSVPYAVLRRADDRVTQLRDAMEHLKTTYTAYLANPQLPHLTAFASMQPALRNGLAKRHSHPIVTTNIGAIDKWIPIEWAQARAEDVDGDENEEGGERAGCTIRDIAFGHRITDLRQAVHVWSVNNEFRLQVQANEAWDRDYLEAFGYHMLDVIKLMDL